MAFLHTPVRAGDATLLDLLWEKQILSPQEYDRVKGGQLTPVERQELLKVLREKDVLSDDEVTRIEWGWAEPGRQQQ